MQISDIQHLSPLGKSDHSVITLTFNCYLDYSKPKEIYLYNKGDYDEMKKHLASSHWAQEYSVLVKTADVEVMWTSLKSKLLGLRDKYVPRQIINSKPLWKEKGCCPISKTARDAIKDKDKAHRHWISALNHSDANDKHLRYTRARNKVKTLIRRDKRQYEKSIAMEAKNNPKIFWSHTRQELKTKCGVAPLLENEEDKNSLKFDDETKANILQNHFSKVYTRETQGIVPAIAARSRSFIFNIDITESMVRKKLKELNTHKSCGPDDIHARLLSELAEYFLAPITELFRKSIEQGRIPKEWKLANIAPIFKKGSKHLAENYRPISLTCVLCRIMESFLRDIIMDHLRGNNLLSPKQHGFICGRSTVTQLLCYLDKCVKAIVEGNVVDTVYLDFMKAFDTVPHMRLVGKLKAYGIEGNIAKWITEYLNNMSQVVVVNGEKSLPADVISGIPQGTVLGPLLFVVYINDLLDNTKSAGFLFADDAKIFRAVTSKEDALILQSDIKLLEDWSRTWLLNFHPDKCHILTFGKFENTKYTHRYKICGHEVEHVFEEKDLGVVFDSELTFQDHICEKVRKANCIIGLIRRSFSYLDCKMFLKMYTSFVRPHLEYAQAVWAPFLRKYIIMIENVQIRATKLVDGLGKLKYKDRLTRLNLPTLAFRRIRGDMIETYKHFHKYDTQILADSFQPRNRSSRQHGFQLHLPKSNDGMRGIQNNSFYFRIAKTWNNLPREVVNAININAFKNKLDEYWRHEPIKFDHTATQTSES